MNNIMLFESERIILRTTSALSSFLYDVLIAFNRILYILRVDVITTTIMNEPLFLFPFGFLALMATVGIFKRILSRD